MTDVTSVFRQDIGRPDGDAGTAAEERQLQLVKPAGALGRLEELSVWLAAAQGRCPPPPLERARVVVFAGDHGVARAGVSAYPSEVTGQMVRTIVAGGAAVNALARSVGAGVRVLDLGVDADLADLPPAVLAHKITHGTGDIRVENAMSLEDSTRAVAAGIAVADEEIDGGADVLVPGDMGIGNSTPAAALIGLLTNNDAGAVTGRGTGIDDAAWMRKAAAVRDAMRRGRGTVGDQVELLATIGGPDIAAMTGFLLQASLRRTPVILDGLVSSAAALVAHRIAFRASLWWLAGHRSPEPGHALALKRLQLEPLVDQQMRLGEGTGGLLALPILRSAQATLAEMATFDEAGVSEVDSDAP
jgi:nicotinate-nucleotide--dimethylbenzimidazole phosphoribosyltransferase